MSGVRMNYQLIRPCECRLRRQLPVQSKKTVKKAADRRVIQAFTRSVLLFKLCCKRTEDVVLFALIWYKQMGTKKERCIHTCDRSESSTSA